MTPGLLEQVRQRAGLTQQQLASRAGTSRPTLSAYEHGRKSPTLATVERLVDRAGFELSAVPRVSFHEVSHGRGRPFFVADRLWRLPLEAALADVTMPIGVNWSQPGQIFRLSDPRQRARCYEVVLREGMPADIQRYVDGVLLVDLWPELVVPREIREAWQDVIGDVIR
jgi:transcriptional regulator with XRE-family HTH domain